MCGRGEEKGWGKGGEQDESGRVEEEEMSRRTQAMPRFGATVVHFAVLPVLFPASSELSLANWLNLKECKELMSGFLSR